MQELWVGSAWWGWDWLTALFGISPMPSIYFLLTLTRRTSPVSRCWPSWRNSLVSTCYQLPAPLSSHTRAQCQRRIFPCLSTVSFPPSVTPQRWHAENVARLLLLCKSSLCYTFLANKANNGRLPEVSRLLVHIVLVSVLRPINHNSCWVKVLISRNANLKRDLAGGNSLDEELLSGYIWVG